jgi:hypothetical protein
MRHRLVLFATAATTVVVIVSAVALLPQRSPISVENYTRIQMGMTLPEAEAILGPPGDYRTGPTKFDLDAVAPEYVVDASSPDDETLSQKRWTNDRAQVCLYLGTTSGRVVIKDFDPLRPAVPTLLENLIGRAEQKWNEWFVDD